MNLNSNYIMINFVHGGYYAQLPAWSCCSHCTCNLMIAIIKPILFAFFKSDAVKKLVVELCERLAKETDNDLDDAAVLALKRALNVWHSAGFNSLPLYWHSPSTEDTVCRPWLVRPKKLPKKFQDLESNVNFISL